MIKKLSIETVQTPIGKMARGEVEHAYDSRLYFLDDFFLVARKEQ